MDRRTLLGAGATLLALQALPRTSEARAVLSKATAADEKFMQLALDQAQRGDLPFGSVIVGDGAVMATGHNSTARSNDPTAHGEMMAIRTFLAKHRPDAFKGTTLYTSGEPCPMCMGAIIWCGISRVVFAASIAELATHLGQIDITARQIADATRFETIDITGGLLASEAMQLFAEQK